ncbi:DUF447 domain-containing protein [Halorientalis regularis]|jgi:hypothetical protein|uniref:DUF447 family protein n=1 Tax=Halorientalis regularis TaxID=660518 RepID=A0A1G7TG51_9EURY|nr:DUF447 domain-containing protein [Halorientalis regularis]SDG33984.1 hypothetical protein SAMN05216218_12517 [Halorientalis regularis]
MSEGWPVELRGVTESVVTTLGPNDRWNVAALGLHAPESDDGDDSPVTARTWGRTRTWRNFRERGEGVVQFTTDSLDFAEAAMTVREESDPVLPSADAWARVTVDRIDAGADGDTQWVEWALDPEETAVERETVPTTNRGYYAVVEATVAASRLDVPAYDRAELESRLDYFADVVERCGGERERAAMDVVRDNCSWDG